MSANLKLLATLEFSVVNCRVCGIFWAVPAEYLTTPRFEHERHFCPNGHSLSFPQDGQARQQPPTPQQPAEPPRPAPQPPARVRRGRVPYPRIAPPGQQSALEHTVRQLQRLIHRDNPPHPVIAKQPRRLQPSRKPAITPPEAELAPLPLLDQIGASMAQAAQTIRDLEADNRRVERNRRERQRYKATKLRLRLPLVEDGDGHDNWGKSFRVADGVLGVLGSGVSIAKVAEQFRVSRRSIHRIMRDAQAAAKTDPQRNGTAAQ